MIRSLAAVLALSLLTPAAAVAYCTPTPRRVRPCKPPGRVKVRDRLMVVSVRSFEGGQALYGCLRRDGRVRELAEYSDDGAGGGTIAVRRHRGTSVVFHGFSGDQYVSFDDDGVAFVPTGRTVFLRRVEGGLAGNGGPPAALPPYGLGEQGQLAFAPTQDGIVSIYGYTACGKARNLDRGTATEIPPSSLRVAGRRASWTHHGLPRSAVL